MGHWLIQTAETTSTKMPGLLLTESLPAADRYTNQTGTGLIWYALNTQPKA